jgi:phosphate-selective porin OprO/OprP
MISRFQTFALVTSVSLAVLSSPAVAQNQPAPTTETKPESEWSIKPRGRLQLDAGTVSTPPGIVGLKTDFTGEVRRAYIGVDIKMPSDFALRAEIDVAQQVVEFTDLYLTYKPTKELTLTAGQHKPFWGLEELTSDLFPSMTERAALNTAFGHERRLGFSAAWTKGPILLQGGVFTRHTLDLDEPNKDKIAFHGRFVFMPKIAGGQAHFGATLHRTDPDDPTSVTYRVRPFIHTTNTRFLSTGAITQVESEVGAGIEAAWIKGPFHVTGEARWQHADRAGALPDPTFFGAYAEIGYFLTKGDTRGYKGGVFDRNTPKNPVGKGGFGAVQVNLRYDYLDLIDGPYVGGRQNGIGASLVWTPTDRTRFILNYSRLNYSNAAIPATGGDRDYSIDAFGMRAQFDF